jgi:hypothetical protein
MAKDYPAHLVRTGESMSALEAEDMEAFAKVVDTPVSEPSQDQ